jgi:hypothetical protein
MPLTAPDVLGSTRGRRVVDAGVVAPPVRCVVVCRWVVVLAVVVRGAVVLAGGRAVVFAGAETGVVRGVARCGVALAGGSGAAR